MRLLRYVQPPTQAGSGDTVLPAMFAPFRLVGASSSALLLGGSGVGVGYSLIHQAADLSTIVGAWGGVGVATAQTEVVTFSPTALFGPSNAFELGLPPLISFCLPVPIPPDLWVMPGERLIFRAIGVHAADAVTSLVWSLLVP